MDLVKGRGALDGAAAEEAVIRADGTLAINLYYARNRYTVRFDGNGATEGDMPEITVYYGQELPLPPNTYHRENEDGDSAFKGWECLRTIRRPCIRMRKKS